MEPELSPAERYYQATLRASRKYQAKRYAKIKEERVENGTYRGRGRPRKVKEAVFENVGIELSEVI